MTWCCHLATAHLPGSQIAEVDWRYLGQPYHVDCKPYEDVDWVRTNFLNFLNYLRQKCTCVSRSWAATCYGNSCTHSLQNL